MRLIKLVPDNTNIRFLRLRVPFFALSALLVVASWVLVFTQGLNYGVDFAGGQEIRATFVESEEAPVAELRDIVGGLGYGEPVIQRFGGANQVSIRVRLPDGAEGDPAAAQRISEEIIGAITAEHRDFRLDGNDTVSGKVSEEFRTTATYALVFASIAIAIYVWVRFEWQFGIGGLLTLFHDASLTLGLFALLQWEFSLQIVAAFLTIIGYSLNDTIVIYDRIRENLKKYRRMPLVELIDLSINETLARTLMTSVTLLAALLPLLLFGPSSLFGMTAAIFFGMFVGTYSSIYISAPILTWLGVTSDSFVPAENRADRQERRARGEA